MNKTQKQRLQQLVRQGIIPNAKLQVLMRAIGKSRLGVLLTPDERNVMSTYLDKLQNFVLGDQAVFNRARTLNTQRSKYQTEESTVEIDENVRIVDGPEEEEKMRKTAENKAKRLSVRKRDKYRMLSPELKKEKSKAGMDEEVANFHEVYKDRFDAALEYYGVTNIRDLPEDKKAEFFAVVDEATKMDPVGQEDDDVDNDGDSDSSDAYLKKRRKAIAKAMKKEEYTNDHYKQGLQAKVKSTGATGRVVARHSKDGEIHYTLNHGGGKMSKHPGSNLTTHKEEVEQVDELKKSTLSSYIQKAADPAKKKSNVNLASKAAYKLAKSDPSDMSSTAGDKEDQKAYMRSKGIQTAAKKLAKEETEQLDEYGNPAATPERLQMIRRAAERVQSGQAAKDAEKRAKRDMRQKGAQKGMAPLKKDVEEEIQRLRKMIKEGTDKAESYRLLAKILNKTENSGEQ